MSTAQANQLAVGSMAPEFSLQDQYGQPQSLSMYLDRWVVLYFYPKDDTPACTAEACGFRDDMRQLKKMNIVVLGVSVDSVESHRRFADKYGLPFPLLADLKGKVASQYDALWSLGPIRFARRHSFIIDPQGRIAKIYRSVNARSHSDRIIADLAELGVTTGSKTGSESNE